jgi:hypothetical protein
MTNPSKSVYFYCLQSSEDTGYAYHHAIICLAEGLKELGIKSYSNRNYWLLSSQRNEYLINHNPNIEPEDCSVIVLDQEWFIYNQPFPQYLFKKDRRNIIVYFDLSDGTIPLSFRPEFRQFDFIFKSHINKHFWYPSNIYPWAFGLSHRIIQAVQVPVTYQERKQQILVNFNNKNNERCSTHSVRKSFSRKVLPHLESFLSIDRTIDSQEPLSGTDEHLMWKQTCYRHYQRYYQRLRESLACAGFGGYFESPFIKDKSHPLSRIQRRLLYELNIETHRISQWDSWRFWESLAAGCVTFQLDFQKYGLVLPVMPENWRHYIGIDFNNIQESIDRILNEPEILTKVGAEGQHWALEHYSPRAVALRFLEVINQMKFD